MPANPILWLDDRSHISVASTVRTASSTAAGYAIDNSREADLARAHKHSDGTSDEYLMDDGGSTSWLGSTGQTAWALVMYDARGADETTINLNVDGSDLPGGTFATTKGSASLQNSEVGCAVIQFTISSPAKRYYRLYQFNSNRGGGTKCAKILYWANVGESGAVRVTDTGYLTDYLAPYRISQVDRHGLLQTVGGATFSNKWAEGGEVFTVAFDAATKQAWQAFRDLFRKTGGIGRAYFVQFEGLRNAGPSANSFLAQPTSGIREARVGYPDQYIMEIEMETCRWI